MAQKFFERFCKVRFHGDEAEEAEPSDPSLGTDNERESEVGEVDNLEETSEWHDEDAEDDELFGKGSKKLTLGLVTGEESPDEFVNDVPSSPPDSASSLAYRTNYSSFN